MKLESIQVGLSRTLGEAGASDPMDREWTTALFKAPVNSSVWVGSTGLAGDEQADRINHGGADMAINVYPREHLAYWQARYGIAFEPGAFGENFSIAGLTEAEVCVGDRYQFGKVVLEVSQPRQPCWKIARRWRIKDLALQVQSTGFSGWYLRVIEEGELEAPAAFRRLEQPHPEWTIAAVNELRFHREEDGEAALRLGACAALSENWREFFRQRAGKLGFG